MTTSLGPNFPSSSGVYSTSPLPLIDFLNLSTSRATKTPTATSPKLPPCYHSFVASKLTQDIPSFLLGRSSLPLATCVPNTTMPTVNTLYAQPAPQRSKIEPPPYPFQPPKPHPQIHLPLTDYLDDNPKLEDNNPIGGNLKVGDNNQTGHKLNPRDNNQTGAKLNLEGNNPVRGINKHMEPTNNPLMETNHPP